MGRCPAPRIGSVLDDRVCAALTWNVFQTLALVAPSFWVRRLRARLVGLGTVDRVPLEVEVTTWERLGRLSASADPEAPQADVLIETEHAVFGLMTLYRTDLSARGGGTLGDRVLQLIDGVSIRAGVRDCYVGLVTSDAADSPVAAALIDRYARSRDMLLRRLPERRDGLVNLRGIGRARWGDMHAILDDCARSPVLDDLQRYAAARAARWLEASGIIQREERSP
jgi:hypothetical protein